MEVGIKGLIKEGKDFNLLDRCSLILVFSSVLHNYSPKRTRNTTRRVRATIIAADEQ